MARNGSGNASKDAINKEMLRKSDKVPIKIGRKKQEYYVK